MAGLYLVPIPIAVPLIVVIIGVVPLTPVVWAAIIVTHTARGARQRQHAAQTAATVGRWIGLSIVLPWAAVVVLVLMIAAQLVLAPFVLLHHLRALHENVSWASARLGITAQPAEHPPIADDLDTTPDISSLPPYAYTPLPRTSPSTIRLLTLHPGPFSSPLRGTLTTTALAAKPSYTFLSHANPEPPNQKNPPPPPDDHILLLQDPSTNTWRTLAIPPACAAALRQLRHLTYLEQTQNQHQPGSVRNIITGKQRLLRPNPVWTSGICVDASDRAERAAHVHGYDRVVCAAAQVVVCTGAAGEGSDALLDWVEGGGGERLTGAGGEVVRDGGEAWGGSTLEGVLGVGAGVGAGVGSHGRVRGALLDWGTAVGEGGGGTRTGVMKAWVGKVKGLVGNGRVEGSMGWLETAWRVYTHRGREAWSAAIEQYRVGVLGLPARVVPPPPEDLPRAVRAFFARPWFRRLWALQEVALPDLARVRFVCGAKVARGESVLRLAALLGENATPEERRLAEAFRLLRRPSPARLAKSCLLDVLLATRGWRCDDPRDRIFAVLNIAKQLDGYDTPASDGLRIHYRDSVAKVYASCSAHLITSHGPGFFLALIKSSSDIQGLPSWAADWTAPWPNLPALAGMAQDVCRLRAADARDEAAGFDTDCQGDPAVLRISRPRVVRGFFTRDGHLDGADKISIENVRQLARDEILVEMYPGLTLLLRREKGKPERFRFLRACPHALSREGVEKVVARWSNVVVHKENVARQDRDGSPPRGYLSLPGVYCII